MFQNREGLLLKKILTEVQGYLWPLLPEGHVTEGGICLLASPCTMTLGAWQVPGFSSPELSQDESQGVTQADHESGVSVHSSKSRSTITTHVPQHRKDAH